MAGFDCLLFDKKVVSGRDLTNHEKQLVHLQEQGYVVVDHAEVDDLFAKTVKSQLDVGFLLDPMFEKKENGLGGAIAGGFGGLPYAFAHANTRTSTAKLNMLHERWAALSNCKKWKYITHLVDRYRFQPPQRVSSAEGAHRDVSPMPANGETLVIGGWTALTADTTFICVPGSHTKILCKHCGLKNDCGGVICDSKCCLISACERVDTKTGFATIGKGKAFDVTKSMERVAVKKGQTLYFFEHLVHMVAGKASKHAILRQHHKFVLASTNDAPPLAEQTVDGLRNLDPAVQLPSAQRQEVIPKLYRVNHLKTWYAFSQQFNTRVRHPRVFGAASAISKNARIAKKTSTWGKFLGSYGILEKDADITENGELIVKGLVGIHIGSETVLPRPKDCAMEIDYPKEWRENSAIIQQINPTRIIIPYDSAKLFAQFSPHELGR